ncbi:MAG: hypothetical protein DCC68_11240 [Planctomycetota bacterium]|nr:MAG: hypothetical protein DCC68_11240 [Planctomycetota bacterium]
MTLALLVTVDTEEEFDWSAPVSSANRSVRHVAELPRLQDVFESCGARPTYVIDHPIATTDESAAVLRAFLDRGACEVGAHVHPWVNPPVVEEICPRNTYLCNLPRSLQVEKTGVLADAIAANFGRRPTTFKAGRYGFDYAFAPHLAALGFLTDTSVIAYTESSDGLGPDFAAVGQTPFWLDTSQTAGANLNGNDATRKETAAAPPRLLEVPCTVGFTRRNQHRSAAFHRWLSASALARCKAVGILWHARLLRKVVFSPEGYAADDLCRLAEVLVRGGCEMLNLTLHSPSIQPGNTPYVRTVAERDAFLSTIRTVLNFCIRGLGTRCLTIREYRDHLLQSNP